MADHPDSRGGDTLRALLLEIADQYSRDDLVVEVQRLTDEAAEHLRQEQHHARLRIAAENAKTTLQRMLDLYNAAAAEGSADAGHWVPMPGQIELELLAHAPTTRERILAL